MVLTKLSRAQNINQFSCRFSLAGKNRNAFGRSTLDAGCGDVGDSTISERDVPSRVETLLPSHRLCDRGAMEGDQISFQESTSFQFEYGRPLLDSMSAHKVTKL